jgi:hypothetical protein
MPTRRITADVWPKPCRHPAHNPPQHMYFPDGVYEHECPSCGAKAVFIVNRPTLSVSA